jgi:N-acetylmuramoyl-L-alanine amidase
MTMNENFKGFKPVLDNGHGGLINGIYQTLGKQYKHPGEPVIYEGVFNRVMVQKIIWELQMKGVPFFELVPEPADISIDERCQRFDRILMDHPNTYLNSIHGNAAKGRGIEGFTTVGKTKADPLCDFILSGIEKGFSDETLMRFDYTDGDRDKEKDFTLLAHTKGPSMIFELGFMDNIQDYRFMTDHYKQRKLAGIISDAMAHIYFEGI